MLTLAASAGWGQSLGEALENGTTSMQLRLSYEHADLADNGADPADAVNLRARLGYRTGEFADTAIFLQFQDVSALLRDYAPLDNGFDPIADPEGTSVHQAHLDYLGLGDFRLRIGRQEIVLENGRMISNADWRQHAQSFDAALLSSPKAEIFRFTVGTIQRVKNVRNELSDLDHLVILQGDLLSIANHTLYLHAYLLDAPGDAGTDRDKATYGFRFTGNLELFEYFLDYSLQTAYADSSNDGGEMTNAFGAVKFGAVRFGVGISQLTGDAGSDRAFDTLFATTHGFHGWTDQFVTNGGLARGMRETYVLVGGVEVGIKWQLRFHQFEQETQSQNYGNEFNILFSTDISENMNGLIKFANYTADDGNDSGTGANDELVYWLRLGYSF